MEVRIDRTATIHLCGPEREGLFVRPETKSAPKLEPDEANIVVEWRRLARALSHEQRWQTAESLE